MKVWIYLECRHVFIQNEAWIRSRCWQSRGPLGLRLFLREFARIYVILGGFTRFLGNLTWALGDFLGRSFCVKAFFGAFLLIKALFCIKSIGNRLYRDCRCIFHYGINAESIDILWSLIYRCEWSRNAGQIYVGIGLLYKYRWFANTRPCKITQISIDIPKNRWSRWDKTWQKEAIVKSAEKCQVNLASTRNTISIDKHWHKHWQVNLAMLYWTCKENLATLKRNGKELVKGRLSPYGLESFTGSGGWTGFLRCHRRHKGRDG